MPLPTRLSDVAMSFHEALRSRLRTYEAEISAGQGQPPKSLQADAVDALRSAQPWMQEAVRSYWLKRHGEPFPYELDPSSEATGNGRHE